MQYCNKTWNFSLVHLFIHFQQLFLRRCSFHLNLLHFLLIANFTQRPALYFAPAQKRPHILRSLLRHFSPEPPFLRVRGLVPPELVCGEEPPDASVTRFLDPEKRKIMSKSARKR